MKILLITGGAGFIGSNLAITLLKKGNYDIHIVDIKDYPKNLEEIKERVNYIKGDVRDKKFLSDIFNSFEFDGVIHLAAVSRVIWAEENPELCISTNIKGTETLFKSIIEQEKKPWIIFGSSREVYGEQKVLPVKESVKKSPINTYGISKLEGEKIVYEYSIKYRLKSLVLRFSNVYGNEKDILDRVIPKFIIRALKGKELEINGGNQVFDFTHIDDTITGIIKAIEFINKLETSTDYFYDDVHILTGKPTKIMDILEIIEKYINNDIKIKFTNPRNYDVEKFYGDPTKAKELLGFTANIDIEEGIKRTIDIFKKVLL